jgi:hypothetical protein
MQQNISYPQLTKNQKRLHMTPCELLKAFP